MHKMYTAGTELIPCWYMYRTVVVILEIAVRISSTEPGMSNYNLYPY